MYLRQNAGGHRSGHTDRALERPLQKLPSLWGIGPDVSLPHVFFSLRAAATQKVEPPPPPISAETFAVCGGDVVGDWEVKGGDLHLIQNDISIRGCASSTGTVEYVASGTMSFHSDGRFETDMVGTLVFTMTLPTECLAAAVSDCSQLTLTGTDAACSGEIEAGCECTYAQSEAGRESGTYTTDDGLLELRSAKGQGRGYCVEGDRLTIDVTPPNDDSVVMVVAADRASL